MQTNKYLVKYDKCLVECYNANKSDWASLENINDKISTKVW